MCNQSKGVHTIPFVLELLTRLVSYPIHTIRGIPFYKYLQTAAIIR